MSETDTANIIQFPYRLTSAEKRLCNKYAMVARKGGCCVACKMLVSESNIGDFQFRHKTRISSRDNKTHRWRGSVRSWAPFTDKWFAWAETVELICRACHRDSNRPAKQLSMF